MSVTPQTIGSPGRMFMLRTVLERIARKNIWLATGAEIADHVRMLESGERRTRKNGYRI